MRTLFSRKNVISTQKSSRKTEKRVIVLKKVSIGENNVWSHNIQVIYSIYMCTILTRTQYTMSSVYYLDLVYDMLTSCALGEETEKYRLPPTCCRIKMCDSIP